MLHLSEVSKEYRRGVRANDGVSLNVAPGEVFGLLGHNGAGKTTLINQVVGLLSPTTGTITLDGVDLVANPAHARRQCALMPQAHAPLDGLSPRQAVQMLGRIRGASRRRAIECADALLAALDITAWADTTGERLSGGVRRLTAYAMAAVEPGRVVMLDEPTNDVDPIRRRLLWQQVRTLAAEGRAVVLVTHNVAEAERSVDRLAVLDHGRVVAKGTPAELRAGTAGELRLELLVATGTPLETPIPTRAPTRRTGRRHVLSIDAATAPQALEWAQRLRADGHIEEFSLTPTSLEDVYVDLVGPGATSADVTTAAPGESGTLVS
ncbi:ABC transporter ATP-binding protein [Lipingzhangella sp. LS1_29]|uniref:ABC transporter ATP-binding protein n=1 Tax=Lipingzhangella rawalii TaxID=2055835 RepID=A0ABU2H2C1_9ACTN|nr:ABC transporter ATP-binding protein [Lipingzhangella rawalii]MDS1269437.1 ABC transporter ATP-binding protein [Lipingzhangella rawalii]